MLFITSYTKTCILGLHWKLSNFLAEGSFSFKVFGVEQLLNKAVRFFLWRQCVFVYDCNSSEPAAVGGSGFQFLPLKKSGVDWNRHENHPISQLKNYAYFYENMLYPIQPISHHAAAYKLTIHIFYLAVAQDRHKPPGESGHVSLFTRQYACAALKISERPLLS